MLRCVHHSTVERVLTESGLERDRQHRLGDLKLASYLVLISATLEQFPTLTAARIFDTANAHPGPVPTHWLRDGAEFQSPSEGSFRIEDMSLKFPISKPTALLSSAFMSIAKRYSLW